VMKTDTRLVDVVVVFFLLSGSLSVAHCSRDVRSSTVRCKDVEPSQLDGQILDHLVPDDDSSKKLLTAAELAAKLGTRKAAVEKSLKVLVERRWIVEQKGRYASSCRPVEPLEAHLMAVLPTADSTEEPLTKAVLEAKLLGPSPTAASGGSRSWESQTESANALKSLLARHCIVKQGDGYLLRIDPAMTEEP